MNRLVKSLAALLLGLAVLVVGSVREASAQSLHLAELFAEQGRLDDALAEVMAWFEIREAEATPQELQHGLWLRGRFAENPAEGMRDLEQLVTRYPQGAFTDRALAWMAAYAADGTDEARARELYLRIVTDFPESPRSGEARTWLRSRGIPVPQPEPVTRPAAPAAVVAADTALGQPPMVDSTTMDAEPAVADSTAVPDSTTMEPPTAGVDSAATVSPAVDSSAVAPRPAVADSTATESPSVDSAAVAAEAAAAAVDTTTAGPPVDTVSAPEVPAAPAPAPVERIPHGPPVPGASEGGRWAVQIGAFRNPDGAAGLVDEMIEAGLDARLVQVPLNDLLRVRVGRFASSDEAGAALDRVRTAGYDGAVVSDARDETVVRH